MDATPPAQPPRRNGRRPVVRPTLAQTQLCRRMLESAGGYCRFFARGNCWFAHTTGELRCRSYALGHGCNDPSCERRHVVATDDTASGDTQQHSGAVAPPIVDWGRRPFQSQTAYVVPLRKDRPMPHDWSKLIPIDPADVRGRRLDAHTFFRSVFDLSYGDRSSTSTRRTRRGRRTGAAAAAALLPRPTLAELQFIEELFGLIDMVAYKLQGVRFTTKGDLFELRVTGLAENRPSVLRGDALRVMAHDGSGSNRRWLGGRVHFVNLDTIVFSMPDGYRGSYNFHQWFADTGGGGRCDVEFIVSRTQELVRHDAINLAPPLDDRRAAERTQIRCTSGAAGARRRSGATAAAATPAPQRRTTTDRLNAEQRTLASLVTQEIAPRVGVLWGPPGTGKTTTLVATIEEILRVAPRSKLLVCAPSNEAADIIVERLHDSGASSQHLLRVNAASRTARHVATVVRRYSYEDEQGGFIIPTRAEIMKYNIVVCTLMTSSKLRAVGVPRDFFTHLLVDEAGHRRRPTC